MMDDNGTSSDQVIHRLVEMGFENSIVKEAVEEVGPSFDVAVEYILNSSHRDNRDVSSRTQTFRSSRKNLGKRSLPSQHSADLMRQSSILDHFQSAGGQKRSRTKAVPTILDSQSMGSPCPGEECTDSSPSMNCNTKTIQESSPIHCLQEDFKSDWEEKVGIIMQKHFGYSSLKNFQKEALSAWLAHKDCLVLAATGSGKSLCFQIPAIISGKVVVVISPLISLMHDQCLKLSKHGVSACFLGSGQLDRSLEHKALRGLYSIIYVCPETVLRLIKPLQTLAENRGIALFGIDEVHCVSKWGHGFRPDYRKLSVLRENFSASNLKFLKYDIPLMALTATATVRVRDDILISLCMSKETRVVLTSFFRSNLRFSVRHSRTSSSSSYEKDFHQLIDVYTRRRTVHKKENTNSKEMDSHGGIVKADVFPPCVLDNSENGCSDIDDDNDDDDENSLKHKESTASEGQEMSVDYLENEIDIFQSTNDWDVACGEFCGESPSKDMDICGSSELIDPPNKLEERLKLLQEPLECGSTIIYVPTRKETLSIAKYLCRFGVKAAAYNASLPKTHLRRVHKEFHEDVLQVIVATVAFGMGIDKLNVRRIIHYGWPQSLEAYYQEAGRAGRDGKLADCILYANLSRIPSLLPTQRSEDQTKQAYKMLADCFRYGMSTSVCRAKILVEYFGEDFSHEKCLLCDVCVNGPPEIKNVKEELNILMQVIAAYHGRSGLTDGCYDGEASSDTRRRQFIEKPNLRMFISKIREQSQTYLATDTLWWRGLARILEGKEFITEGDDKIHVQIKYPKPTKLGLEFLQFENDQTFNVYPEADMLLSLNKSRSYSTFADWGKGWADPDIRRQRLERMGSNRKPRKPRQPRNRQSRKRNQDLGTARGRIQAKLLKQKQ
ncbi:hypothetical protein HS088_TW11G00106 [Tripterygium wilfordii]|uniref:ATP-dependent DNA helicase n=1 Tax=Tripterygium wilfordii TaxID=458696 RepID=A0A7J7D143_TRIWF|nr:ATP-dependent DNA helicase Q-like SIM [Tripterygium wilfordii]XP_038716153.1 ATP-dependent DNA helicase Q-like SIM [Tripterygium wilfordii]KAF5740043.1 hypothetical protein HS088_TW11G00106 [Tripterygium wilfordii]